ncbi:unnamed protein product [Peniophora sp. CBMAI 1063]|nr:unnamed protein product [Peniophora sp. CBMAI 1063]
MAINWNDPTVLAAQYLDFIKLQHALGGVLIWELVTSLSFDYNLLKKISQHQGQAWAKWFYLACRYTALGGVVTIFAGFNVTSEINCKTWIIFVFIWAFLAIQCASTLVAIRVIAIWNKSMYIMCLCGAILAAQLAFFFRELAEADAAWVPLQATCLVLNTQTSQANVTVTLCTDVILLVSMLIGLLRRRQARTYGLWRVLWNQGLMWLALATIAEVPTVIFLWLNLNQVMNLMFFTPEMIILVIGATRMYRALSDFTGAYNPSGVSASARSAPDITPMRRMRAPQTDTGFSAVVPLEVDVHRTFEEHQETDKRYIADSDIKSGEYPEGKYGVNAV